MFQTLSLKTIFPGLTSTVVSSRPSSARSKPAENLNAPWAIPLLLSQLSSVSWRESIPSDVIVSPTWPPFAGTSE